MEKDYSNQLNLPPVTEDDLGYISRENGQPSVGYKSRYPEILENEKGFFGRGKGEINLHWIDTQFKYIEALRNSLANAQLEQLDWGDELPEGLDVYRLEAKIRENGACGIYKDDYTGKTYAVGLAVKNVNMYNQFTKAVIVEPRNPEINGLEVECLSGEDIPANGENITSLYHVAVMRNNYQCLPDQTNWEWELEWAEKVLFQICKNPTRSAPKGVFVLNGASLSTDTPNDNAMQKSFEAVINGDDTFYTLSGVNIQTQIHNIGQKNMNQLFEPIELTDQSEALLKQYLFHIDQAQRFAGLGGTNVDPKNERTTVSQDQNQNILANSIRKHAINIRKTDAKIVSKLIGVSLGEPKPKEDPYEKLEEEKQNSLMQKSMAGQSANGKDKSNGN